MLAGGQALGRGRRMPLRAIALQAAVLGLAGLLLPSPAPIHASSSSADSAHFCLPFNYEQWRRSHPQPAVKPLSDLNVGQPRTVRMIYFLPSDRPFRQEVVDSVKVGMLRLQTFFSRQMQAHGYEDRTLRIETDAKGKPLVHPLVGQHPDEYYLDDTYGKVLYGEIGQTFDLSANLYFILLDNSTGLDSRNRGGGGSRIGKNGGFSLLTTEYLWALYHEFGHALGLRHDFSNGKYIMSYSP